MSKNKFKLCGSRFRLKREKIVEQSVILNQLNVFFPGFHFCFRWIFTLLFFISFVSLKLIALEKLLLNEMGYC